MRKVTSKVYAQQYQFTPSDITNERKKRLPEKSQSFTFIYFCTQYKVKSDLKKMKKSTDTFFELLSSNDKFYITSTIHNDDGNNNSLPCCFQGFLTRHSVDVRLWDKMHTSSISSLSLKFIIIHLMYGSEENRIHLNLIRAHDQFNQSITMFV